MIMMLISFLFTAFCIFLQGTVFQSLALAGVVPNLALASVLCFSYQRGHRFGLILGFLTGLLMDILFSTIIGLDALIFMTIGVLIFLIERIEFRNPLYFSLTVIGGGSLIYSLLYYVLHFLLRGKMAFGTYFVTIILPEMLYTVLVGVILFPIIRAIHRWYQKFEFREE
ncbi:MAG: rod shape-determining protein MreD [Lachnospiraceae bacterium]|nr:rod shape-determining protein MreD [Lachnospiraceae bacterium]